jgi:hypothetical protein
MENIDQTGQQAPAAPQPENASAHKQNEKEFSITWNLKILAVIYVILGVLYLIMKFTLK